MHPDQMPLCVTHLRMLLCCFAVADNYIETVHGGLEMETNPPYLMYTHGNDEV
jgi:hypothetical protein